MLQLTSTSAPAGCPLPCPKGSRADACCSCCSSRNSSPPCLREPPPPLPPLPPLPLPRGAAPGCWEAYAAWCSSGWRAGCLGAAPAPSAASRAQAASLSRAWTQPSASNQHARGSLFAGSPSLPEARRCSQPTSSLTCGEAHRERCMAGWVAGGAHWGSNAGSGGNGTSASTGGSDRSSSCSPPCCAAGGRALAALHPAPPAHAAARRPGWRRQLRS